jgi:3'(2'), 5'-bisphosphate nucleotidase
MNDHELAIFLAESAGQRLLELRATTDFDVNIHSSVNAFEKMADKASNDFLLEQLAIFRPEDAVLSEESPDSEERLKFSRVWIIDPVDGSYEFARSTPEFAIHVALWESGELVAGAIAIPNVDAVWSTQDDVARDFPLHLHRPLTLVVSTREPIETVQRVEKAMQAFANQHGFAGVAIIHCGSVGGKTHQVIADVADVYVSSVGFYEWDSAAPAVVALHHGLRVTDFSGDSLTFNQMPPRTNSFIVAKPWLHECVLNAVQVQR